MFSPLLILVENNSKILYLWLSFLLYFFYYAYLLYVCESQCFSVMVNRYQKHDVGHTFTFCDQDFFVQICYTCLFSLLKVKKLDAGDVNNKLSEVFKFYLGDWIISRLKGHAKTCFEMLQTYLRFRATKCEPDKVMSVCYFRCLKFLVCYILSFDLYVLAFKKDI